MGNFLGDGSGGPGVGGNALDPLDLRKSGSTAAAQDAANLQSQSAMAGIDEQRRQFDALQEILAPYVQAGMPGIEGLGGLAEQFAGIGGGPDAGMDQRLSQLTNSDAFNQLTQERLGAVQNQLGQAGLTRSGAALQAAADVPTDLALQLENQLYGREQQAFQNQLGTLGAQGDIFNRLAGLGQASAAGVGAAGQDVGTSIANLLNRSSAAQAQGAANIANIEAGRNQNATQIAGAAIKYLFSDPRLKMNMAPIGQIADLTLYEWDWIPEVRGATGCEMSIGYSADEVAEKYPQHVIDVGEYKAINYPALNDELERMVA
jgi:hypothetical protein